MRYIFNNYPAKSRGILPDTWPTKQKIEQDNCFIIQQIVNKKYFTTKKYCGCAALCDTSITGRPDHIWASRELVE